MKIAQYKSFSCDYVSILTYNGDDNFPESCSDYTRISEYVEVDFIPLPEATITLKEVAFIDEAIEKLFEKVEILRTKKAEKLSLTFQEEDKQND